MKDGGTPEKQGRFYLLDTDLSLSSMNKTVYTTNGMTFSPDGQTMYFSDSNKLTRSIWSCSYDIATGRPGPAELFFDNARWPAGLMAVLLTQRGVIGLVGAGRFTVSLLKESFCLRLMCLLKNQPNQCLAGKI